MMLVNLDDFMVKRGGSVNPKNFEDEMFELLSIPAFDKGKPEIIIGKKIGSSKKCVEPNDILLSKIVPHIRRCWVVPPVGTFRQIASGEWIQFRSEQLVPEYLRYILVSDHFHCQFMNTVSGVGGSLLRASPSRVVKIKIPIPPLAEQKTIAAILDAADKLRQKDQQLIDKYSALSQSLFLDMFGDPVTNPMGWDESNLQKFFSVPPRIGTTTPASKGGEIKVVRVGELGNKKVNFPKCKNVSLPTKEQERYLLDSGDIILARAIGSEHHLGKASLFEHIGCPVVFDSHVMRLRFNKDLISPLFFYHWLSSNGGRATFLKNSGQTAVQFNINAKQISRIKIKVPPIALQNKFAERIQAIEAQKQLAQAALQKSEDLFNSLLQRAFKGELTA